MQSISADAAARKKPLRENRASRLLELFRAEKEHENGDSYEPPGLTKMSYEKAASVSESLRNARPMDEENVNRWVSAWKKSEFI